MIDVEALKAHIFDIVGLLYEVHNELGPGLNERLYQEGLMMELSLQHIPYEREYTIHPRYKGLDLESVYRIDFLVRGDVVVELKAVPNLTDEHRAQLFNYMRLSDACAGILVNFATQSCQIERYFHDKERRLILTVYGTPVRRI